MDSRLAAVRAVFRVAVVALAHVAFVLVGALMGPGTSVALMGAVGFCLVVVLAVLEQRNLLLEAQSEQLQRLTEALEAVDPEVRAARGHGSD